MSEIVDVHSSDTQNQTQQSTALVGAKFKVPSLVPPSLIFDLQVRIRAAVEVHVLDVSPFKRSSARYSVKKHGSLIVNHDHHLQRHPCLIVEVSRGGFRVRGSFRLKRGQVVEVILDEDPLNVAKCSVVWVGRTSTNQQGEVGLETIHQLSDWFTM